MANIGRKISQLDTASVLTGNELIPIVQNGITLRSTAFDISNTSAHSFFIPESIYFAGTSCANVVVSVVDYYPIELFSSKIDAPNLTTIVGSIHLQGGFNNTLNEINFPQLNTVGGRIYIEEWNNLETINLNSLNSVVLNIEINSNNILESINLNSLQTVDEIFINSNTSLTHIGLDSITSVNEVYLAGNALNQTTIDTILAKLVAINYSNKSINLSGGTNAVPSATGAGYVVTLRANGCTVTTN